MGKKNDSTATQKIVVSSPPAGHCQNDFQPWENENKLQKMGMRRWRMDA